MIIRLFELLRRRVLSVALQIFYRLKYYLIERQQQSRSRRHDGTARHDSGLWCIFAYRQGATVSQNLLAYIGVLNDCGYNILLVNNGPLSARHIELFQSRCHTLVAKYYGGRDFGCFQYGTKLLQELAASRPILQVIYCNESVFVRPSQLSKTVERIRQSRAPHIGLTGTWESAYHVSSWLFSVSGELFRDPAFQQFWADYLPISSRTHAIWYGEIGLSAHLQRHGIQPEILYPPQLVGDLCVSLDSDRLCRAMPRLSSVTLWYQLRDRMSATDMVGREILRRIVLDQGELHNTSNLYNLLLVEFCDFPFLKKDLVFRNDYSLSQIEEVLRNWDGEDHQHVAEIVGFFRSRGAMRWRRGIRGVLIKEGLI
jgi:hypothetical protein